jgi:hypothetical protein
VGGFCDEFGEYKGVCTLEQLTRVSSPPAFQARLREPTKNRHMVRGAKMTQGYQINARKTGGIDEFRGESRYFERLEGRNATNQDSSPLRAQAIS